MAEENPRPDIFRSGLPQRKSLPPFESLRAFDAVARLGSIRKASEGLCRDHAVISRHIKALESWTRTPLIERTPNGAMLTESGASYHKLIASAIDTISTATINLLKRNEGHFLYAWCMPGFASQWLMARLEMFQRLHPDVDIELRPTDTMPDFERREADVDVRFVTSYEPPLRLGPSVKSINLASPPSIAVASPAYLARALPIERPHDLLGHRLIHEDGFEPWNWWLRAHGVDVDIELTGPRLWHAHLTLEVARRDGGIALSNTFIASEDLEAGRLVEVGKGLPGFDPVPIGNYFFIARADRWDTHPVRLFRQWLIDSLARDT